MTSITEVNKDEESWISRLLKGTYQRHYRDTMQQHYDSSEHYRDPISEEDKAVGDKYIATTQQEIKQLRQANDDLRNKNKALVGIIQTHNQHRMETSMTKIQQTLPELPIALRPGFNVLITGLPTDMTQEESDYISGILYAYSQRPQALSTMDYNPETKTSTLQPSKDLDKSVQRDIDNGMAEALKGPEAIRKVMEDNASIIGNQPTKFA